MPQTGIQGIGRGSTMVSAKPRGSRAEPPPLLDSVVRFLVWTGIIGGLATPIVLMLMLSSRLDLAGQTARTSKFEEVQRTLWDAWPWRGGIVAGGKSDTLGKDVRRLRDYTAFAGEAATVANSLEVIVVRIGDGQSPPDAALPQRAGYRTISLDITGAHRTGVLLVADAPILWNVVASSPTQRARIGFEGAAPFDIANGYPGLLAGFRVASFGAESTMQVRDALVTETGDVRRYCASLEMWAAHFGVQLGDVGVTFIDGPTSIRISDRGVVHDGSELSGRTPFSSCTARKAR